MRQLKNYQPKIEEQKGIQRVNMYVSCLYSESSYWPRKIQSVLSMSHGAKEIAINAQGPPKVRILIKDSPYTISTVPQDKE